MKLGAKIFTVASFVIVYCVIVLFGDALFVAN